MGSGASKSVETVKAESFEQSTLTDESMSIINMHTPSSLGGAMVVMRVLGLACLGYGAARMMDRRNKAARRAATMLEILKSPA